MTETTRLADGFDMKGKRTPKFVSRTNGDTFTEMEKIEGETNLLKVVGKVDEIKVLSHHLKYQMPIKSQVKIANKCWAQEPRVELTSQRISKYTPWISEGL